MQDICLLKIGQGQVVVEKKIATVGSHYVFLNLYFSRIRLIEKKPLERICTLSHERTRTKTHGLVRLHALPNKEHEMGN